MSSLFSLFVHHWTDALIKECLLRAARRTRAMRRCQFFPKRTQVAIGWQQQAFRKGARAEDDGETHGWLVRCSGFGLRVSQRRHVRRRLRPHRKLHAVLILFHPRADTSGSAHARAPPSSQTMRNTNAALGVCPGLPFASVSIQLGLFREFQ